MKVKVVTIANEGDVEVLLFAKGTYFFNTLKKRVKEWVDEDTERKQQDVLYYIDKKITTFKELSRYARAKFGVLLNVKEQGVIE